MTRDPFFPCQTPDGRTYVMRRGRRGSEPVIHAEVAGTPDTTARWREAQRRAKVLNNLHAANRDAARFWRLYLAFIAAMVIVAWLTWG